MISLLENREAILEVEDLVKTYRDRVAVGGISFSIHAGEIFGLLGPNGAGKTTTIDIVAAVLSPTQGRVRVFGDGTGWADEASESRRWIGFVPQQIAVYPHLTAEENLRFFGSMYGLAHAELSARAESLLQLVGLASRRHERVATYSGGMKRRLNLVCGLIHRPQLLLLDEPTVGMDAQSRERVFSAVERLAREGMAILYTTHYMEEAERLCHRVAIMDEGRFVGEGTKEELAERVGRGGTIKLTLEHPASDVLRDELRDLGARSSSPTQFLWAGKSVEHLIPKLLATTSKEDNPVAELLVHRPDLGEIFFHLTGKELRD